MARTASTAGLELTESSASSPTAPAVHRGRADATRELAERNGGRLPDEDVAEINARRSILSVRGGGTTLTTAARS